MSMTSSISTSANSDKPSLRFFAFFDTENADQNHQMGSRLKRVDQIEYNDLYPFLQRHPLLKELRRQLQIINKVVQLAERDANVSAVLMYGSFTRNEGDEHSDVEFYIFLNNKSDFNSRRWVNRVEKVSLFFTNEFGTEIAVFDSMIRGKFHFLPVAEIGIIKTWEGFTSFEYVKNMKLVDKNGHLAEVMNSIEITKPDYSEPMNIRWLAESLLSSLLWVKNLIRRGEQAHATYAFSFVQKYFLQLVRIAEKSTDNWENPTKGLENDISTDWYGKYQSIVPTVDDDILVDAFVFAIKYSEELFVELNVPKELVALLRKI
jgi:lincosamide nucleotidyltransferase